MLVLVLVLVAIVVDVADVEKCKFTTETRNWQNCNWRGMIMSAPGVQIKVNYDGFGDAWWTEFVLAYLPMLGFEDLEDLV